MSFIFRVFCSSILLLFLFSSGGHAQETIFKDLSYPYLEKLIATAKQNYPEVRARQAQVNIAQSTFHQSQFGWLDSFTASYIYSPQTVVNSLQPYVFKGYQLVGSVSIGSLFERPYTIHNAKENLKLAEAQQAEYLLALEAQVKRFYFAYIEAQADLRSRVNAVLDATTAVNQLKHTFDKGEITFQVYNEALVNLYSQNSYRVQGELAVFNAKTNLEELIGTKLETIK